MQNTQLDSSKFLSEQEDLALDKLLALATCSESLMLSLLRKYGMRTNELLRLRPCDFNRDSRTIRVSGSKGSNSRELPLDDELFERLDKEASMQILDDGQIFPITRFRLFHIWHKWRPCKKKLHSLRHTCAVNLYRKTKDIKLVQKVLGHKSISNTMIYMDFVYSQDELRKALVG